MRRLDHLYRAVSLLDYLRNLEIITQEEFTAAYLRTLEKIREEVMPNEIQTT